MENDMDEIVRFAIKRMIIIAIVAFVSGIIVGKGIL